MKADFQRGVKVCSKCKEEKPLSAYAQNNSTRDKLCVACKGCRKISDAIRNATPEAKARRKNYLGRPEIEPHYHEYHKTYSKQYRLSPHGIAQRLYYGALIRARDLGLPFDLTPEYVLSILPTHCPVLGVELVVGAGGVRDNSFTLDRIKPDRGYVRGNVAVMSRLANVIKSSANSSQIMAVADWLKKHE